MDNYTIAEEAYKNGYVKGYEEAVKNFVKEVKEEMWQMCFYRGAEIVYPFTFVDDIADKLVNEMNNKGHV